MKKVMFFVVSSVMCSILSASTEFLKKNELSTGYVDNISNVNIDAASRSFLKKRENSSTDFDLRVGFVDSLLEIQSKDQKSNSFFDTVAIWVSYRF